MRRGWTSAAGVAVAGALSLAAAQTTAGAPWWQAPWTCRREVTVVDYKPTKLPGDDIAVVTMPTGGLVRPDGGDVRVASPFGAEVPCRVLMVGPGDMVRVAFAVRGTGKTFYAYFGHPSPPPAKEPLEIRRGILLETWEYLDGGIKTLPQVQDVLTKAKRLVGRDFRDTIFLGHNPFGPQFRIASVFTAYVVCESGGPYQFAISSQDASFLLVNDKLVVDNGGHHPPQGDVSVRGAATLAKGLNKLTFYHVNTAGNPVAVAAWQAPGENRIWPIPAKAFAPVFRAVPGPMERYGRSAGIDFLPRHGGEVFLNDRYYQRWEFEALPVGQLDRRAELTWDFGDGQTAAGAKVEHVFLVPGQYAVSVAVKGARPELTQTHRIFVSRPWDQVTENKLDSMARHGQIVGQYDFAALTAEANAHAVLLLDRAGSAIGVRRAGLALLQRGKAPPGLLAEVVPIYAATVTPQEAVAALVKGAAMSDNPAVAASLTQQAGRAALDRLDDPQQAMSLFQRVIQQYAAAATTPALRDARIGIGDVWRIRGDCDEARRAYAAAGLGEGVNPARLPIHRGDFARHAEEYIRKGDYASAAESLQEWAAKVPADKLEGYWSLLTARLAMAQNRFADAAREARVLANVNPASNYAPELLLLAAEAYRKLGQEDQARAALKRVVEKYPESPLAAQAAKMLKS